MSSQNSYVEILTLSVIILGDGAFASQLGHKGGALLNRISVLIRREQVSPCPHVCVCVCVYTSYMHHIHIIYASYIHIIYMCTYIYMYVCMCVSIIYIHTHIYIHHTKRRQSPINQKENLH